MSDEILLYTKLSKRIFKFSCTKKYISRKSYAKTVSDDFGNTCKEWALKFVSCKCIFLNLLVADGLMYSRWFWDMRYKSNFGVFGVLLPILYYLLDANSIHKIHITHFTWLEKQACFNLDCSSDAVSFFNDNVLHLIPLTSWFHPFLLQLVYFWQKSF